MPDNNYYATVSIEFENEIYNETSTEIIIENGSVASITPTYHIIPDWQSTINYVKNDIVKYNGKVYFCHTDNLNKVPPNNGAYWYLKWHPGITYAQNEIVYIPNICKINGKLFSNNWLGDYQCTSGHTASYGEHPYISDKWSQN